MFVYLSKKIAIPNNTRLNCISWNKEHGYIAVGGDEGLLKVLKLEQASGPSSAHIKNGLAAPSNLSMNQTLEGHKAAVQVVTWNDSQQKLTTSDRDGVIMVWMLYKGAWYEEMTNDRKKSTVKGMAWTADGQKICIIYEDGAIIVGSVDGSRIWGKELKNTPLTGVQWSPDGRLLLFSLRTGELHLYDNQGSFAMKLNVQCINLGPSKSVTVIGLSWFHGTTGIGRPVLVICYENGKMQLMKNENDEAPVIIDTQIQAIDCQWNPDGTILAVCGTKPTNGIELEANKESNMVLFYTAYGVHLRTLKIPGREMTSLSWEGRSLRIALSVDSFIYFANIRPDYDWCYFCKTVAFVVADAGKDGDSIIFWDTSSNQCYTKHVENLLGMASNSDHCVLAIGPFNMITSRDPNVIIENNYTNNNYQLIICNSISTSVDSKYIEIRPEFIDINSYLVVVASKDHFLLWHYHTPKNSSHLHGMKNKKLRKFHIDDSPSGAVEILNELDKDGNYTQPISTNSTSDPICCLTISETHLLIGRESGGINEYVILPQVTIQKRYTMSNRPYKMSINSNSTRAAVIDATGQLTTIDLMDSMAVDTKSMGQIERKDVWAMCWARDNPQLLAIMEKTRMYVFRGADPEEPISCSGYICNFEDLEITGILLDEIVSGQVTPDRIEHLLQLRVKSLRDTEELLTHVGIGEAKQFIEDNSHPRLWRLLAEAALKRMDLEMAESAFVRCTNYPGIQLIKRLKAIGSEALQRAEVAAFFGNFDDAEKLYIDADRRDLAIGLRQTLCDWFRTVQLYQIGPGTSDQQMEHAWREIGKHFSNERSWESAKEYFVKGHDIEGMMESYYHLEQYDELENCIQKMSDKNPLLAKLGQMLASVGMCNEAVTAYIKLGDVKSAVNTCVNLKQWGQAVELAQKYKMPQIGALLGKHAAQLLQEGRLPEAIELQRKAGRYLDAARLMVKLAEGESDKKSGMLRLKKLYVLAGLLTEEHLRVQMKLLGVTRTQIIGELSPEDSNFIEDIWLHAKAYHFMLLAQRQMRSGLMHSAVLTAIRLRDYETILRVEDVYSLLALTSLADRSFGICSKAFIKLESLDGITDQQRQDYEELAVNIFYKHEPNDNRIDRIDCFTCESLVPNWCSSCPKCGTHFPPCIASGKSLMNPTEAWQCLSCYHCASPMEMANRHTCPLCHCLVGNKVFE